MLLKLKDLNFIWNRVLNNFIFQTFYNLIKSNLNFKNILQTVPLFLSTKNSQILNNKRHLYTDTISKGFPEFEQH